jgi:predicted DNA-binding ribbon-helix-helix protein
MRSSGIKKHSIALAGHRTSVNLEEEFWTSLREIAHKRGTTLPRLIEKIDMERKSDNLASALRIFVLCYYRHHLDQKSEMVAPLAKSFAAPNLPRARSPSAYLHR